jgi:hypothetical protein
MTIKTREPGDAFKRQVTDFVPVKKRRPWRDEQAVAETETIDEATKPVREIQGATTAMANPAIAPAAIVEVLEVDGVAMANPAIAPAAIVEPSKDERVAMANPAIASAAIVGSSEDGLVAVAIPAIAPAAIVEASRDEHVAMANPAIAPVAIVESSSDEHVAMANSAIAPAAIVDASSDERVAMAAGAIAPAATAEPTRTDGIAVANPAIAPATIVEPSRNDGKAIANPAIAPAAIDDSQSSDLARPIQEGQNESLSKPDYIAADVDPNLVRSQRARAAFVFNVAIKRIGNPMDGLLFCYLWHRVEETGTTQIRITLNELSEGIGASKRGVQDAVKRLTELGLIENINAGTTYVPIFRLTFRFKK